MSQKREKKRPREVLEEEDGEAGSPQAPPAKRKSGAHAGDGASRPASMISCDAEEVHNFREKVSVKEEMPPMQGSLTSPCGSSHASIPS